MPVTTYLNENSLHREYPFGLENAELADTLQELRSVTQKDWVLREAIIIEKPRLWFRKPTEVAVYSLYVGLGGGEYQQINFYDPAHKSPFPPSVGGTVVMAYMIGYLAGRG